MTRKVILAAMLMAAFAQGTQAQDLSGQRSEKQDVHMILVRNWIITDSS